MHGRGKEYEIHGHLIYDGEYLNGERHGKGKLYDDKFKLEFEGKFVNGRILSD